MADKEEKGLVQELQNIHLAIAQLRIALDDIKKNFALFDSEQVAFKKAKYRNDAEKNTDDFLRRLLSVFLTYQSVNEELTNLVNEMVEFVNAKTEFKLTDKVQDLRNLLKNNMGYARYFEKIYRNFGLMAIEEIPEEVPAQPQEAAAPAEEPPVAAAEPAYAPAGAKAAPEAVHREVFQSFKIKCEDINDTSRFTRLIGKVYKDCCEKYNVFIPKEVNGEWIKARRASDILPYIAHEMENAAKNRDGFVRFQIMKENSDYTVSIEYAGT
jgi:negative regulator of replication initiation